MSTSTDTLRDKRWAKQLMFLQVSTLSLVHHLQSIWALSQLLLYLPRSVDGSPRLYLRWRTLTSSISPSWGENLEDFSSQQYEAGVLQVFLASDPVAFWKGWCSKKELWPAYANSLQPYQRSFLPYVCSLDPHVTWLSLSGIASGSYMEYLDSQW